MAERERLAGRIEALPGFAAPFDLLAMQAAEIGP